MEGVQSVAVRFEDERPRIVEAYERALAAAGSPLLEPRRRWSRVRRQAESILRDCAAGLRGEHTEFSAADWVSLELMGARRAVDGVPLEESLHAAQLLWGVTRPALERATASQSAEARAQLMSAARLAFRRSTGSRLRAGAVGYGDTHLIDALLSAEAVGDPARSPFPSQRGRDARDAQSAQAGQAGKVGQAGQAGHDVPEVHALDGGAHRRIAAELGIPESHVRSTLRAALRRAAQDTDPVRAQASSGGTDAGADPARDADADDADET
ncbi:hypothetical protein ABIA32_002551 [Streptacidiphilus sp. MAP12-20]|uniref:hypothetical protein n=1 Tax=Streptacidiphilus sp. MAP12-20 TaxID=3156299 RepID=UPI003517161D